MSDKPLILIGGGENAVVVAEAARLANPGRPLAGFVDVRPPASSALELPWLGDDNEGLRLARAGAHDFVIAVGATGRHPLRRALATRYESAGAWFATIVHPRAIVSPTAVLGAGSIVLAGAVLNAGSVLGAHCLVNTGAILEHDVGLGDYGIVGPGGIIGGGTTIGPDAFLGLGCRVRDHLHLGRRVLLAMGAVLVADAPDDAVLVGVPARAKEAA